MKDNEFDRLLSQSMKEYGHEYLHGADGPAGTGPVPVHKFRDDFISDIAVNKPKKKPGVLRCVRFAGAAAAVFVAAAALMIVPQAAPAKGSYTVSDEGETVVVKARNGGCAESALVSPYL